MKPPLFTTCGRHQDVSLVICVTLKGKLLKLEWHGVMWSCNFPCILLLQKYYYYYIQKKAGFPGF